MWANLLSLVLLSHAVSAWSAPSCTAFKREDGDAFNCKGQVTAAEAAKFSMRLSNASWVRHFQLFTNVTASVPDSGGSRACEQITHLDAGMHYVNHVVPINDENFAKEEQTCLTTVKTNRFFCIRGTGHERGALVSVGIQASVNAQVQVRVATQETLDDRLRRFSLDVGGSNGRAAFHMFTMPEDPGLDLWRLSLNVPDHFQRAGVGYHAYIMHESSPCIAKVVQEGGCLDPLQVWSCFQSVPVSFRPPSPTGNMQIALSESFTKSGMMTISRGSVPGIQSGRWLLFVVCNLRYLRTTSNPACPEAHLEVELHSEYDQLQKLRTGTAIMIFGPALVLFCVNAMYWLTYKFLNYVNPQAPSQSRHSLWPVFMSMPNHEHLAMLREKMTLIYEPVPFFPALLALMIGVFLATAAQFVITHFGLMARTGNRDICFYNERCYHPGIVWDVPWNHILSNLAYFVAGVHTMLQTFFAESRCRHFMHKTMAALFRSVNLDPCGSLTKKEWAAIFDDADVNRNGVVSRQEWQERHRDVIAFDFIDETDAGSLSREEWFAAFARLDANGDGVLTKAKFQLASRAIDVRAFYAIATTFIAEGVGSMCYHLCPSVETFQFDTCFMISIAHLLTIALADWGEPDFDMTAALKYFVYILTPIWLINFIGTWYDIHVFNCTWIYWTYTSLVVMWTVGAVTSLRRVFAGPDMGTCSMWTMRLLQGLIVLVVCLVYVDPNARESLGGTANTFLLLSIAVMAVVVSRQIYMQDFRFMACGVLDIGGRILKYSFSVKCRVCCNVSCIAYAGLS